ncbi:hypothetical protein DPMN_109223 [Dreissena polymorpha]|uniref:Uncharacterized protein n=1 Tax=Dreissena polymorpha TaxID=45954 RepID=A0A9D4KAA1_DREPO|nr:hypothetical protein DPMN_109223 [Dreissena polymorpha]
MDQFITDLRKYHTFLTGMQKRSNNNHQSPEPIRQFNDSWSLITVNKVDSVREEYSALDLALKECCDYIPIDLLQFEPKSKEDRGKW